jgi:hypothetical protein
MNSNKDATTNYMDDMRVLQNLTIFLTSTREGRLL